DLNNPCDPVQAAGYIGYDAANAIWAAADCDSDGVTNGDEDTAGSDPYDAGSTPTTDTDGDGVPDVTDTAPNDPCLPVQTAGYTGYDAGNAIWTAADCDGDGVTNGDEDTAGSDPYFDDSGTLDDDNDGVPNSFDLCDNTPPNTVVDVTGCEVFTLPNTNFNILSTGETCISSNDGSIEINAENSLDYTATLTGSIGEISSSFTTNTSFTDLTAGDYTLCFTVQGQPNYENCFSVKISEPEALSVDSKINTSRSEVTLDLSGGKIYHIELNDIKYQTTESKITLSLSQIENLISVKTDKDCQGIYEETIMLSSEVIIYPNPISYGELTIFLGNYELKNVQITLYTINGVEVFNKPYSTLNNEVKMDFDTLPNGSYILNIKTEKSLLNYKLIKR
ncbi:MAG: T9SS type A sorting domain-containing protein, partial [Bacteroidia bacterium]|nr:T9SS type A sorting domain-containing protein [Bacteroidia bacterium]